mgnify:CR=1 FL=1
MLPSLLPKCTKESWLLVCCGGLGVELCVDFWDSFAPRCAVNAAKHNVLEVVRLVRLSATPETRQEEVALWGCWGSVQVWSGVRNVEFGL